VMTFVEEDAPPEPEPVIDEAEVPRRPDAIREREERREDREDAEREESAPALAEDLEAGVGVLRDLLALMGVEAEVALDASPRQEGIEVLGPDLGALIGRGGENLVALQQITSAITSRRVGRTVHVPLDIEGYRRRREEQLREIARRVASRVKASGQAVTLEPMLAYERRIVHLAVQEQPGIKTESVGMDPNRRVVISSTAAGARGPVGSRPQGGGFRPGPRPPGPGGFGGRRPYPPRPAGVRPPRPGGFGPAR
jgi:spoIIIJ-associated protein